MIKNKLSGIMGEKRMNIAEVARLTGKSYNAINKIYHNKTKSIDFATMDKLCWALQCNTQDLFAYIEE